MLRATNVWALMLTLWLAQAPALAGEIADKLPDTTVGYIRVADAKELLAGLQKTGVGRMAADRELRDFVGSLAQAALDYQFPASSLERSKKESAAVRWRTAYLGNYGEVVLAIVTTEIGDLEPALIIEHGSEEKQVNALAEAYLASANRRGGQRREERVGGGTLTFIQHGDGKRSSAAVYQRDDRTFQCDSASTLLKLVEAWEGRSSQVLSRSAAWLNHQRCATLKAGPAELEFFGAVSDLIPEDGKNNVNRRAKLPRSVMTVGGRLSVARSPYDLRLDAELVCDSKEGALGFGNGPTAIERWVPKGAATYATVSLAPFASQVADKERVADQAGKLAECAREWGMPLPSDLESLSPYMTGRLSHCRWYADANRDSLACDVIAAHVLRNEAFERVREDVIVKLGDAARQLDIDGVQLHELSLSGGWSERDSRVYLVCLDDSLLLTSRREAVQCLIEASRTAEARLAEELEFRIVASKLKRLAGEHIASAMFFGRPRAFVSQLHGQLENEFERFAVRDQYLRHPFYRSVFRALEEHPLPPLAALERYLAPCGGTIVQEGNVLRLTCFVPQRTVPKTANGND